MIANRTPLDILSEYAAHDPHGGYHADYDDGFPSGSLWRVEGQFLYSLVRLLKPASVLELGTWHGASATHLLQGVYDNGSGGVDCIDNRAYGDIVIGDMIPAPLRPFATLHNVSLEDAIAIALEEKYTYDLIYEDAMHTAEQVECVWRAADRLLNPGGVIISHDAMHPIVGPIVRAGITAAGFEDAHTILLSPSDCGFAYWQKGEK